MWYLFKLVSYFGFYSTWKEYFFVLTNGGLLQFDKPGVIYAILLYYEGFKT